MNGSNEQLKPEQAHEYQHCAYCMFFEKKRVNFFFEMGLGKTMIGLSAVSTARAMQWANAALVVTTNRVKQNNTWQNEARNWSHLSHLTFSVLEGTPTQRKQALRKPADIYLVTYHNLIWLIELFGDKWPFKLVICDESHNLKNPKGKRFKKLKKVIKHTTYWMNLTGTPATNGLTDVWAQMYLIDAGKRLGRSYYSYLNNFFTATDFYGYKHRVRDADCEAEIHKRLRERSVSLKTEDYVDMPPITYVPVEVPFPDDALVQQYKELEAESFLMLEDKPIAPVNAAGATQKLRQFCNGALYYEPDDPSKWVLAHNAKLDALEEIVEQAYGEPVIVAYQFKSDLARLRKRFPWAKVAKEEANLEERFNAGKIPMLLMYPGSDSEGLNLQKGAATRIIWFGMTWDLKDFEQLIARLWRQGQTKHIFAYIIMMADTIETVDMYPRIWTKQSIQETLKRAVKRQANDQLMNQAVHDALDIAGMI